MSWFLVLQNIQHHRDETMNCIGVLTIWGLKGIWAQSIKSSEGQRVTIY
jgi:hypothetical protein